VRSLETKASLNDYLKHSHLSVTGAERQVPNVHSSKHPSNAGSFTLTHSSLLSSICTMVGTPNKYNFLRSKRNSEILVVIPSLHDPRAKTCECIENIQSARLIPPIPDLAILLLRSWVWLSCRVKMISQQDASSHRSGSNLQLDTLRVVHAHK
jgi:hypothetical protein